MKITADTIDKIIYAVAILAPWGIVFPLSFTGSLVISPTTAAFACLFMSVIFCLMLFIIQLSSKEYENLKKIESERPKYIETIHASLSQETKEELLNRIMNFIEKQPSQKLKELSESWEKVLD